MNADSETKDMMQEDWEEAVPPEDDSMTSPPKTLFPPDTEISEQAQTLLVVDDDAAVRRLLAQILNTNGYRVLQAANPTEALQVAGVTETIHLLVTDYSVHGGGGLKLTREFRAVHPETPVLMVSGSRPEPLDTISDLDHVDILDEPFTLKDFMDKIRALLETVSPQPGTVC